MFLNANCVFSKVTIHTRDADVVVLAVSFACSLNSANTHVYHYTKNVTSHAIHLKLIRICP